MGRAVGRRPKKRMDKRQGVRGGEIDGEKEEIFARCEVGMKILTIFSVFGRSEGYTGGVWLAALGFRSLLLSGYSIFFEQGNFYSPPLVLGCSIESRISQQAVWWNFFVDGPYSLKPSRRK